MSLRSWFHGPGWRGSPAAVRGNCGCYRYPIYGLCGDRRCAPDAAAGVGWRIRRGRRLRERSRGVGSARTGIRAKQGKQLISCRIGPDGACPRIPSARSARGGVSSGERVASVSRPDSVARLAAPYVVAFSACRWTSRDLIPLIVYGSDHGVVIYRDELPYTSIVLVESETRYGTRYRGIDAVFFCRCCWCTCPYLIKHCYRFF